MWKIYSVNFPSFTVVSNSTITTETMSPLVKAGWVCLAAGACTFWLFGLGFLFFAAGIVLAVVALCHKQVRSGIWLLISSLAAAAVCGLRFFFLVLGAVGGALRRVASGTDSAKPKLPVVIPFKKPEVSPTASRFSEPDDIRLVTEPDAGKTSRRPEPRLSNNP
jgi:hypothetical protein